MTVHPEAAISLRMVSILLFHHELRQGQSQASHTVVISSARYNKTSDYKSPKI